MNPFFPVHWASLHGVVVFLGLSVYSIGSHTLKQRRHPSSAIAWFISLVVMPYVALPLYLMFGNRKIAGNPSARPAALAAKESVCALKAGHLSQALGLDDAVELEQLAIHQSGREALESLRRLINHATGSIDLCTYLLGRDVLGRELIALLAQRARDGVRIRLLIDGIGFYLGGRPSLRPLVAAGVQVALFVPPLRSSLRGRTNLRNHRKMLIADGHWLWSGGRNLAAEYFEGDPASIHKREPWVDLSFELGGGLARQAQNRFELDWAFARNVAPQAALPARPSPHLWPTPSAQLVPSGPDQADDTIYALLLSACFTAQTRILAVSPYFVPDQTLLQALVLAARRGVAVELLLPHKSNHHLADIARHASLRDLTAAGARVWVAPGMIHAKAFIIDQDMALVGSANLDERSLFLNYELMVAFYGPPVVERFAGWIELQKQSATRYTPRPPNLAREVLEGSVRLIAFQL